LKAFTVASLCTLAALLTCPGALAGDGDGERVYRFYCYQCHGYGGDARTLAATFMSPRPRDFTATDTRRLSRDRLLASVREGRPGTAMVAFRDVLDDGEIRAVVDYLQTAFMGETSGGARYHSAANGWADHERFAAAFPFATGELQLDATGLSREQTQGRHIYLTACISCHDRGNVQDDALRFELRPVSYPRHQYDHRHPDLVTGASPYAIHDVAAAPPSPSVARGFRLFQDNCAFCHGADASGRNWIGSFLTPAARDLRAHVASGASAASLTTTIREGLPGTSMPAWRHVLSGDDIDAITDYLLTGLIAPAGAAAEALPAPLSRAITRRRDASGRDPDDRRED